MLDFLFQKLNSHSQFIYEEIKDIGLSDDEIFIEIDKIYGDGERVKTLLSTLSKQEALSIMYSIKNSR